MLYYTFWPARLRVEINVYHLFHLSRVGKVTGLFHFSRLIFISRINVPAIQRKVSDDFFREILQFRKTQALKTSRYAAEFFNVPPSPARSCDAFPATFSARGNLKQIVLHYRA